MRKIGSMGLRAFACALLSVVPVVAQVNVVTQHNDIGRTGQNTNEVILTPQNVNSQSFGKLFSVPVDGALIAQPLYLSGVGIPGSGTHNVVFTATEHDSVYAFDADMQMAPLWQASLLDSAHGAQAGAIPEPSSDIGCTNIAPEYGVSSTPVIDPASGTLYVVSVTSEYGYPVQRLHALDVTTGAEKFGGPATISATVAGTGTGSSNGLLSFDPKWHLQRAGLLLVNGNVYISFGSHCDFGAYHGWLFAYNASTLQQTGAFVTSPNGYGGGVWMAGAGLAADTSSTYARVFMPTGNGTFDATVPYGANMDYADSILQLTLNNGVKVTDDFTPYNQDSFKATDGDVSSGGFLALPDQTGPNKHLAVQLGKSGSIYLLNRDSLGGYSAGVNKIVQQVDGQVGGLWGMPAYWNGNVYLWPQGFFLSQFTMSNGVLSSSPVAKSIEGSAALGITPSVSSNGNTNGIVWTIDHTLNPQILTAHDALNVGTTLYSSASNPVRDSAGPASKFAVPTIANGKVYVGATGLLTVFGLAPAADFSLSVAAGPVSLIQAGTATSTLTVTPLNGFNGSVSLSAAGLPSGVSAIFTSGPAPTLTLTAMAAAPVGVYPVTITGTSGSLSHLVAVNLQVLSSTMPDFGLSASPAAVSLVPGALAVNGIILTQLNGFNANPAFSVTGLPNGVTSSFTTVSGNYYVMSLSASASVTPGTFNLLVTGTSGALVRLVAFSLTIQASPSLTSVELVASNSSKCLGVSGDSLTSGAVVVQSACTPTPGQIWDLVPLSGDTYKILSPNSGLALSVSGGAFAPGTLVVQNSYTAATGQQWLVQGTPWGFSYILNASANQCLDVQGASSADGTLIDQSSCSGATSQMWAIRPVHMDTQVDLSSFFNSYAIVTDGTYSTGGGLGLGYALSATTLAPTVSWNQNAFNLGPVNFKDAVTNTTVGLPAGIFTSLQFLAVSVYGNQTNQQLQVFYTDGTTALIQQSFSDWGSPMNFPGESQAVVMSYRIGPGGEGHFGPWYLYGYSIPLNNGKIVQAIQLPSNPNVFVLAMTLVK